VPAGHLLWVYAQTVDAFVDAHGRSPEPRDRGRDPRAVTAAGPKRAPRFALRSRLGAIAAAAMLSSAALAQQHDPIGRIAAENAELSTQAAAAATALDRAGAELARLQKSKDALAESLRRIERRAEVHALGREFAETVIDRLRLLPRAERFAAARAARADLLAATSDAALRVERERDELGDLEAAVVARLAAAAPPVAQAARPQVEAALRGALASRSDLLARVAGLQERLVQTLREVGEAERALEARGEAAHAELTRLLFWIPAPPVTQTLSRFPPALAWTVSPAHWRAAAAVVQQEFARSPFWPALALLAAAILYAARGRLRQALVSLAPGSVTYERYRVGHALAALAITFGLAAPGATVLWTLALLLGGAPEAQAFVHALGAACAAVARLLLALSAFAWLLDRGGMAVGHFGWDEATAGFAVRVLRRFMVFFVPLIFVAALNSGDYAPFANRESLGRLMFNLAMIAVAALLVMLLRRGSPLMRLAAARAPRAWAVRLHGLWFTALVALPLGMAALAAMGYFVAAAYFYTLAVHSVFLVLGALLLYGLIALWVQVQRSHLARRHDAERAPPGGADAGKALPQRLDVAALGEQTRSLLQLLITLLLVAGMWWLWRGALQVVGDYTLWTYHDTVDGKTVTHPLTVAGLSLALMVVAVTAVGVRNIGALLDIVLLQRLDVQPDATYAVKVMAQYALTAAGVVAAADILGIGWSDVQWLIAALGVGLGFGLQEIFANFISGLIVLAERPIRIGDVVTVGDVSGTVARIRARATAVVDFDNKEVIIPNKAFITERVVNWTLSNQTTRLLLKVGVAYGSDVALVQRVLLEAVGRNPGVLRHPGPSVFFVGFGDSSLDFEIRAFVGAFDQRLRVRHELLLAVDAVLREHGIEIPFPQRDVHIRSGGAGG
jgi:potassium efflux system protein